jgi:hypothetical protein
MRMWPVVVCVGVALGVALMAGPWSWPALGADGPAATETAAPAVTPSATETADPPAKTAPTATPAATTPPAKTATMPADQVERLTKMLGTVTEKMLALQTEELQVSVNEQKAVGAAAANVEKIKDAPDDLYHGKNGKGLQEYKQALMMAIGQWQAVAAKFAPLAQQAKGVERDRAKAPTELQTLIDMVLSRVQDKQRTYLQKLGDLSESAGEYKKAISYYSAEIQSIPETKRGGESSLMEKIVNLSAKTDDGRGALAFYKALQEILPERQRYRNGGLGLQVCDALEKINAFKDELDLLKALHEADPGNGGISDRIAKVQKKVAGGAGTTGGARNTKGK